MHLKTGRIQKQKRKKEAEKIRKNYAFTQNETITDVINH